jgi:hypothetical protein
MTAWLKKGNIPQILLNTKFDSFLQFIFRTLVVIDTFLHQDGLQRCISKQNARCHPARQNGEDDLRFTISVLNSK